MRLPPPRRLALAFAGPLVIVAAVLVVLHAVAFGGKFTNLNPDVPTVFLANHCFLGESMRAGHLPVWNPYSMAGVPFAGDPQAGWRYFPAAVLYTLFPCSVAIRLFILLQPILIGLGVYALLRGERCGRVAATTGGAALALAICGSKMAVSIPFTDALAWTALLLPSLAKTLRATTWRTRLLWTAATAIAWGQLACAHLSHGFVMGSTAAVFYGVYVVRKERSERSVQTSAFAVPALLVVVATVVASLAHLLPVVAFTSRATIGLGYDALQAETARLSGGLAPSFTIYRALGWTWPLRFVTAPGFYLGAIPLLLTSAAFVSRRTRPIALCFASFGLLFYVLGDRSVVTVLAPRLGGLIGDFYRHGAGRFLYAAVLAMGILVGLGVEAWLGAADRRQRIWMIAPGAVFWLLVPLLFGAWPSRLVFFVCAALVAAVVLYLVVRSPALVWLVPALVVLELSVNAFWGQHVDYSKAHDGLETEADSWIPFRPLPAPSLDARRYVAGGQIERAVGRDPHRLLFVGLGLTDIFRPVLSHIEVANGYNPVELTRYWRYIRSIEPDDLRYNMSLFPHLPPANAIDLLDVGWIATAPGAVPARGATEVVTAGGRTLYRLPDPPERATVVTNWEIASSPEQARRSVSDPRFDPAESVVLEGDAPTPASQGTESATDARFRWVDPSHATVTVDAPTDAVVLVRNAWDEGWHATVDGSDAEVMPADYFLQGVAVP
ncbi:MAG TPA: hypothetical protein VFK89_11460, partial [Actinomycetota bacterium]|nr:hypothetical protein [Actinomycetota bacterium]